MSADQLSKLSPQQLQELLDKEQAAHTKGNAYSQDYWKVYEELASRKH